MAKRYHGNGERSVQTKKSYGKAQAADMKYKSQSVMNQDAGMIQDDWSAPALLPRMVIDKDWPHGWNYMNYGEADLFTGVQKQIKEDHSDMKKAFGPRKY